MVGDYGGFKKLQDIRSEWQDIQRRNRELIWHCRKRLKEPLSHDEREEVEQVAFDAMQRLQTANEEIERLDENMAHLRQLQEKAEHPERTDLGTIVLICIFFLLIVFLLSR